MKQVSKGEFFAPIYARNLDVHPYIVNERHPYTEEWRFPRRPGRPLYGKTVDRIEGGTIRTAYFIAEALT